jgi:hypothetical protein
VALTEAGTDGNGRGGASFLTLCVGFAGPGTDCVLGPAPASDSGRSALALAAVDAVAVPAVSSLTRLARSPFGSAAGAGVSALRLVDFWGAVVVIMSWEAEFVRSLTRIG